MIWITVDRSLEMPLIRQVYEQVRQRILRGELQAGERLPSTRELASNIEVSRNVIIEAYEQLLAEGYIEGHRGSGTFIAEGAYLEQNPGQEDLSTCIPESTVTRLVEKCQSSRKVIFDA